MILWIDRVLQKCIREYRKAVFRKKIHCPHKQFTLVRDVIAINPNVTIGKNVTIYPGVQFFGDGPIVIGDRVNIGNNTMLYASKEGGITIGDKTVIAADCYIIDADHGIRAGVPVCEQEDSVKRVQIGNDVWLAAGAKVLKGSVIGAGAVVGALSLVKGEVESNAVVCGVPAKVLKYREG